MLNLYDILNEELRLVVESQESKSIAAAKKLVMKKFDYDEENADRFVREKLRHDIPSLRDTKTAKFILGATRMVCDGELRNEKDIRQLNTALRYASADDEIEKFDRNLNGLSFKDFYELFEERINADKEAEDNALANTDYSENGSNYEIVAINNFEQASQYAEYVSWCVCHYQSYYNSYTENGECFYFCLADGFEDTPKEVEEGCPLDEYGLSMIAVRVDPDGEYVGSTCRWNHDHGGSDEVMSKAQLCEVVGVNFEEAFPYNEDAERGMAMEEYLEYVEEDARTVWQSDGEYFELSQDREPNSVPEEFKENAEGSVYYVYNDDRYLVGNGDSYTCDACIESINNVCAILKKGTNNYDILAREDDEGDAFIYTNYTKYAISNCKRAVVARGETDDNLSYFFMGGSRHVDDAFEGEYNIQGVDFVSGDADYVQVLHNNDTFSVWRFNDEGEFVMLFANETPANGKAFKLEQTENGDITLACASGRVYNKDGEIISGEASEYDVSKTEFTVDSNGTKWLMCKNSKNLVGLVSDKGELLNVDGSPWYRELRQTPFSDYVLYLKGKKSMAMVNVANQRQLCDFSDSAMVVRENGKKTLVMSMREYGWNDTYYVLTDYNGTNILDNKPWRDSTAYYKEIKGLSFPFVQVYFQTNTCGILNVDTREYLVSADEEIKQISHMKSSKGAHVEEVVMKDGKKFLLNLDTKARSDVYSYGTSLHGVLIVTRYNNDSDDRYMLDEVTLQPICEMMIAPNIGTLSLSDGTRLVSVVMPDDTFNFFTITSFDDYEVNLHGGHWVFKNNIKGAVLPHAKGNIANVRISGNDCHLNLDNGDVLDERTNQVIGNVNENAATVHESFKRFLNRMNEARSRRLNNRII